MTDFSWSELRETTHAEWLTAPPAAGGVTGVTTDSRQVPAGSLFVALSGDRFDGHDYVPAAVAAGAAAVLVARPVAAAVPVLRVPDPLRAYQQLAAYHRARFPELLLVAVTGSCGKTSTKEIIASVLQAWLGPAAVLLTAGNTNNQVGVPQNLLRLTAAHRAAVLELGTNRPGEIAILTNLVRPRVAVITNVGPVHLEGLGSLNGVAREKASIFTALDPDGLGILHEAVAANPVVDDYLPPRFVTVGTGREAQLKIKYLGGDGDGARFRVWRHGKRRLEIAWGLRGEHMALNAGAAVAVADFLRLDDELLGRALADCRLPHMRMETLTIAGTTWINDAYNANPDSMKALFRSLAERAAPAGATWLVLGDMLELGAEADDLHREVLHYARELLPAAKLLVFGPVLSRLAPEFDVPAFTDLADLRAALVAGVQAGDRVALKGSRGMALERLLPPP